MNSATRRAASRLALLASLTVAASISAASITGTVVSDYHYNPSFPGPGTVSYDILNWSVSVDAATNQVQAQTSGWLYSMFAPQPNIYPFYVRIKLDGVVYASQSMMMFASGSKPILPNVNFSGLVPESAITRGSSNPHVVTFELIGSTGTVAEHRTVLHVWKV